MFALRVGDADIRALFMMTPYAYRTSAKGRERVLFLKELGFKKVYVVEEQELPDPKFSTLKYPNPEDPKAFAMALALAKEKDLITIIKLFFFCTKI